MKVKRTGLYIDVGEGIDRWSFPDPSLTCSTHGAYSYLLRVCPTTKDAMKKLADMRRALRILDAQPSDETGGER